MKVTGPGSGAPPGATDEAGRAGGAAGSGGVTGPDEAAGKGKAEATTAAGKAFADKLEGASATTPAVGPAGALGADGAALKAGTLSAETVLERAIGRILDKQVGAQAPPAVRAQVEAALRDAIASDPLLIDKIKILSSSE
jgi:hypothetical protein